jgi:hypothetical protein
LCSLRPQICFLLKVAQGLRQSLSTHITNDQNIEEELVRKCGQGEIASVFASAMASVIANVFRGAMKSANNGAMTHMFAFEVCLSRGIRQ